MRPYRALLSCTQLSTALLSTARLSWTSVHEVQRAHAARAWHVSDTCHLKTPLRYWYALVSRGHTAPTFEAVR